MPTSTVRVPLCRSTCAMRAAGHARVERQVDRAATPDPEHGLHPGEPACPPHRDDGVGLDAMSRQPRRDVPGASAKRPIGMTARACPHGHGGRREARLRDEPFPHRPSAGIDLRCHDAARPRRACSEVGEPPRRVGQLGIQCPQQCRHELAPARRSERRLVEIDHERHLSGGAEIVNGDGDGPVAMGRREPAHFHRAGVERVGTDRRAMHVHQDVVRLRDGPRPSRPSLDAVPPPTSRRPPRSWRACTALAAFDGEADGTDVHEGADGALEPRRRPDWRTARSARPRRCRPSGGGAPRSRSPTRRTW